MVYRYSWLAAFTALAFAFYLLNGLLQPTTTGPAWQFIVVSAVALGIIITWTAVTYRLRLAWIAVINLAALLIALMRIAAPETTVLLFPTRASFVALGDQLQFAFQLIRNGIEPVVPLTGIVVIVTAVFWIVGALMAWGLTTGHPYVGVIPPLVLSLQFATMDRAPSGIIRITIFVAVVAAAIFSVNADERDLTAGRMARRGEYPSRRNRLAPSATALMALTVVGSVGAVGMFQDSVPRDGVMTWRTSTGIAGDIFGGVSYNAFIGIHQSLITPSDTPVFVATINGDVPPDQLYFRLTSMETYNGGQFFANVEREAAPLLVDVESYEAEGQAFSGPTLSVTADVTIDRLLQEWLPSAYAPRSLTTDDRIVERLRARPADASIIFDGGTTFRGFQYTVESAVPDPDLGVLAALESGALSPTFQLAADADEPVPALREPPALRELPPNADRYLAVPEDIDPDIEGLAREQTRNLRTDFERGLALEAWFHSRAFRYTTDIAPGHGATDLAAWLLDEESPNFHAGYCENFATAMAVMARTLDIPSRVVLGFTPGDLIPGSIDTVVVRDRNAHAWVELWMPTQGWVRFDPTPRGAADTPQTFEVVEDRLGFDLRDYLDVPDPDITPAGGLPNRFPELAEDEFPDFLGSGDAAPGSGLRLPAWWNEAATVLGVILLGFGTLPAIKWWIRRRRLERLRSGDIGAAWEDIVDRLSDLGEAPNPTSTPNEVAATVDPVMVPLATVYCRAVYGRSGGLNSGHVETATQSLARTSDVLRTRYSTPRRLRAMYSPGTVLPAWIKRLRNGTNGNGYRNGNGGA
ncbi:MAG TPA: transglutaminaseTgpA domain-containing protein [Acidimicrobiia bacterium]|jgi:transglutaminase-like putative cysteine protease